jgi:epsilon-lactone hydrolase
MADDLRQAAEVGVVRLPAREIPPPAALSPQATAALFAPRPGNGPMPAEGDLEAWRAYVALASAAGEAFRTELGAKLKADVAAQALGGVATYVARPRAERLLSEDQALLDFHGGGLIFGGGASAVSFAGKTMALRTGRVTYSVDYRMPPDAPYPAALDDAMAAYRALLEMRPPGEIVVSGVSAGGNVAAALLLGARDEGLPMPAGALLLTPEVDLTESGDSFSTLEGLDFLTRLMPVNRLYAAGADLAHPYLSPLFGEFSGFPPVFLQTGTRDLFLSNTARLHRRLRAAGVRAELNVWDGMPHGGFGGFTPEDREVNAAMREFLASL